MLADSKDALDLLEESSVRERFTAFVSDEASEKLIQQIVGEMDIGAFSVNRGDINSAISMLEHRRSPKALLVDLSGVEPAVSKVNKLAEVCEPGVAVMALGERNDVGLFRDLLLAGMGDYLVKPLSRNLVEGAMTRLLGSANISFTPMSQKLGQVVSVVGARGGIGASTIATNLAWGLANKRHRRVALIDLNLKYGSCGLMLNVNANSGLREALERPQRVDDLFLERAMVPCGERLALLTCKESFEDPIAVDPAALPHLLTMMRKEFHFVVIDAPRQAGDLLAPALALANTRILVIDQTTLALRDMLGLRDLVKLKRDGQRNLFVLNRFGELGKNAISAKQVEEVLGSGIDTIIPFDAPSVVGAANIGVPLLSRGGAASRAIESIADDLGGFLPTASRRRLWSPFRR